MIYREIGKNKDKISAIGLGTCYHSTKNESYSLLERSILTAIGAGINFIDTAPVYGDGESERILGRILKTVNRSDVFIASKISPGNTSFSGVVKSIDDSLSRLKTDTIDLCQIHWPNPKIPIEETMSAMEKMVEEGKIRNIGISNFSLSETRETILSLSSNSLASIQSEYNFFERSVENDLLPFCNKNNILMIGYSPLSQGKLVNGNDQESLIRELSEKYNATPGQIVLRWLIENTSVVVIPNTSKERRVLENSKSTEIDLTRADIDLISKELNTPIRMINTSDIRVSNSHGRKVYETLQEALDNSMGMSPSPEELSKEMISGNLLKPVRLKELNSSLDSQDGKKFDLVEGRLRYWAWVIANGCDLPIPSLIWRK